MASKEYVKDVVKRYDIELSRDPNTLLPKAYVMKKMGIGDRKLNRLIADRKITYIDYGNEVKFKLHHIHEFANKNEVRAIN